MKNQRENENEVRGFSANLVILSLLVATVRVGQATRRRRTVSDRRRADMVVEMATEAISHSPLAIFFPFPEP